MFVQKLHPVARAISLAKKYCDEESKKEEKAYPDLSVTAGWVDLYSTQYINKTYARELVLKLLKNINRTDVVYQIFYNLYDFGWPVENLSDFMTKHLKDPEGVSQVIYDWEVYRSKPGTAYKSKTIMKKEGQGVNNSVVDNYFKFLEADSQGRLKALPSYAVIAPCHRNTNCHVSDIWFENIGKEDWEKILIPIIIMPTYPRWTHMGYPPCAMVFDGYRHIVLIYVNKSLQQMTILDSNGSYHVDLYPPGGKMYEDIAETLKISIKKNLNVQIRTTVYGKAPQIDFTDKGDCVIFIAKFAQDISEEDEKKMEEPFNRKDRIAFRKYLVDGFTV